MIVCTRADSSIRRISPPSSEGLPLRRFATVTAPFWSRPPRSDSLGLNGAAIHQEKPAVEDSYAGYRLQRDTPGIRADRCALLRRRHNRLEGRWPGRQAQTLTKTLRTLTLADYGRQLATNIAGQATSGDSQPPYLPAS